MKLLPGDLALTRCKTIAWETKCVGDLVDDKPCFWLEGGEPVTVIYVEDLPTPGNEAYIVSRFGHGWVTKDVLRPVPGTKQP